MIKGPRLLGILAGDGQVNLGPTIAKIADTTEGVTHSKKQLSAAAKSFMNALEKSAQAGHLGGIECHICI